MPGTCRWEALYQQALFLLRTLEAEMQSYHEQRSERWQEAERGEALAARLQALQEVIGMAEELAHDR